MTRNHNQKGGLVRARTVAPALYRQEEEPSLLSTVLKNGGWGLLCFIGAGLILITAMTIFAYAQPDPDAWSPALSLAALLVSSFIGGFVASKKTKEASLVCGIITGTMITLTLIALSLILHTLPSSGHALWQSAVLHGACVLFCILGAFAGNVKKAGPSFSKKRWN